MKEIRNEGAPLKSNLALLLFQGFSWGKNVI